MSTHKRRVNPQPPLIVTSFLCSKAFGSMRLVIRGMSRFQMEFRRITFERNVARIPKRPAIIAFRSECVEFGQV